MKSNNLNQVAPNILDYYKNILKRSDFPAVPLLPKQVKISFGDKNRDNFFNLGLEALKRKQWEVAIKTESQKV